MGSGGGWFGFVVVECRGFALIQHSKFVCARAHKEEIETEVKHLSFDCLLSTSLMLGFSLDRRFIEM